MKSSGTGDVPFFGRLHSLIATLGKRKPWL